jgi:peptidoglycan/xylan/chitin deacetylase (PgdA/CDA1 family)
MKAILTFHSIDDSGSVLSYPPALFSYLLQKLDRDNIPVVDMATLLEPSTHRGVVLTFDDGMNTVFENALPILKDFGATAHLFVTTNAVNSEQKWPRQPSDVPEFEMLSWQQIEDLHKSGVMIDAHTVSHPDVRKLSEWQLADECEKSNEEIERRLGRRPEFFAYPFGYHNREAREFCRSKYCAAVTTELRSISRTEDMAALPRLDTYYLRSHSMVNHLDELQTKLYLRARWLLRTLRGSHCVANYDN